MKAGVQPDQHPPVCLPGGLLGKLSPGKCSHLSQAFQAGRFPELTFPGFLSWIAGFFPPLYRLAVWDFISGCSALQLTVAAHRVKSESSFAGFALPIFLFLSLLVSRIDETKSREFLTAHPIKSWIQLVGK